MSSPLTSFVKESILNPSPAAAHAVVAASHAALFRLKKSPTSFTHFPAFALSPIIGTIDATSAPKPIPKFPKA
jgi:hypothetical protein